MYAIGYVFDGAAYCTDHTKLMVFDSDEVFEYGDDRDENGIPIDARLGGFTVGAILEGEEWDYVPSCDVCWEPIEGVSIVCYCDSDFTDCAALDHYNLVRS